MENSHPPQESAANRGPASSDTLKELIAECLARVEESGSDALEDFCAQHPDQADAIRSRIKALNEVGFLAAGPSIETENGFPKRLGDFRLLRRLGGGGMGVVYLAHQESLGREVALKLIRPEQLFFPRARERFRREVEAVARLQHPGIVPVYTVGEAKGVPHFAMERIEGCTLAQVLKDLQGRSPADLTGQDLAESVVRCTYRGVVEFSPEAAAGHIFSGSWVEACFRLIRQVAEALSHAHGRGVLHRDIKPSNIMVTPTGRVMLLDFGLATAEGSSKLTRAGSQLGSLPYMSPEQVAAEVDRIDCRTDVYSLGVTLYELLSLRCPYLNGHTETTRRKIIDGNAESIRSLNPSVSWEAETVCQTAMEIDLAHRYETAADFGRDMANVLERRPIEARRPSLARQGLRWAQRNPSLTATLSLVVLIAVGGPLVFAIQERRANTKILATIDKVKLANKEAKDALADAELERQRAEEEAAISKEVVDFLVRVFEYGDPSEAKGESLTVLEVLDRSAFRIRNEFRDRPVLQARLMDTIGTVYGSLANFDKSRALLEEALAIERAELGDRNPYTLSTLNHLGTILHRQAEFDASIEMLRHALEEAKALHGEDHPMVAVTMNNLAAVLADISEYREAEELMRQARTIFEQGSERDRSIEQVQILSNLGTLLKERGNLREAGQVFRSALQLTESLGQEKTETYANLLAGLGSVQRRLNEKDAALESYRKSWELVQELFEPPHPMLANSMNNLAIVLEANREGAEAEKYYKRALAMAEETHDENHPRVADFANNLAEFYRKRAEVDKAWDLYQRALRIRIAHHGEEHLDVSTTYTSLALLAEWKQDYEEAERLIRKALQIREKRLGPDSPRTADAYMTLAGVLSNRYQYGAAATYFEKVVDIFRDSYGETHIQYLIAIYSYGKCLLDLEDYEAAEPVLQETLERYREHVGPDKLLTAMTMSNLAFCHHMRGRYLDSEELYRDTYELVKDKPIDNHMDTTDLLLRCSVLRLAQNDPDEAERIARDVLAQREEKFGEEDWRIDEAESVLGSCLVARGLYQEAEPLLVPTFAALEEVRGNRDRHVREALERVIELYEEWEKPDQASDFADKRYVPEVSTSASGG